MLRLLQAHGLIQTVDRKRRIHFLDLNAFAAQRFYGIQDDIIVKVKRAYNGGMLSVRHVDRGVFSGIHQKI